MEMKLRSAGMLSILLLVGSGDGRCDGAHAKRTGDISEASRRRGVRRR